MAYVCSEVNFQTGYADRLKHLIRCPLSFLFQPLSVREMPFWAMPLDSLVKTVAIVLVACSTVERGNAPHSYPTTAYARACCGRLPGSASKNTCLIPSEGRRNTLNVCYNWGSRVCPCQYSRRKISSKLGKRCFSLFSFFPLTINLIWSPVSYKRFEVSVVYMLREGGACHGNGGQFLNKQVSASETPLFKRFRTLQYQNGLGSITPSSAPFIFFIWFFLDFSDFLILWQPCFNVKKFLKSLVVLS